MTNTKQTIKLFSLFALLSLTLFSCQKDEEDQQEETQEPVEDTSGNTASLTFGEGDGAVYAIQSTSITETVIGPLETTIGTGVALFTSDNFNSFMDAGSVSLNGSSLTKNGNNSYTHIPGLTDPMGIDFSSSIEWNVSGMGSVPAFTLDLTSQGFPEVDPISSPTTVDLSSGYTLSTTNIANADSIIFLIEGVYKTLAGDVTSYTFSADELSSLSPGMSSAQIAAFNISENTVSGSLIYGVNEKVQTISVTLE